MPTYEYVCEDCGYEFEQFQSITARAIRKCPKCGKMSLKRLIGTGSGIIFKGNGFYETDYRSRSYKEAEKNEKNATKKKTETTTGDSKKSSEKNKAETKAQKQSA